MVRQKRRRAGRSIRKAVEQVLAKKVEVKKQTIVNTTTVSTGGTIIPLLEIAQGIAHDQRIGNSCQLLSFYLRQQSANGDSGYNRVRTSIVKCRGPSDGTMAQFFENTSFSTFGSVNAGWDYDFVERVMVDKQTVLNQLVSNERVTKYWKRYLKCNDKIHYNDSATAPPNEYYYLVLSSDSLLVPHPTANLMLTYRFTDM